MTVRDVSIDYTNWRGERSVRVVLPARMWWGKTEFHPTEQFLLHAFDIEKQSWRDFAMENIHSWSPAPELGNGEP